ncbi:MAG: hypothetical protein F6K19_36560 [Cyanothece sp. SIO1E1]|nr:hypothetical protein [Cyanothece sp. SIO1E1]
MSKTVQYCPQATISIGLFDRNDEQVGTAIDQAEDLNPGATQAFKADFEKRLDVKRFQVKRVSGCSESAQEH